MHCHPIFLVFIQTVVTAVVIGFTHPGSAFRWGALPLVALCFWQCITTSIDYLVRSPWASLVGGHSTMLFFQYIDVVLLRRWNINSADSKSAPAMQNGRSKAEKQFWRERLVFGLSSTWNCRFVGTPEQVKNVPCFSDTDPDYVPSRGVFLRNMVIRILLSYIALDIMGSSADPELSAKFFTTANVPVLRRLGEISAEELLMRVFCMIGAAIALVATQGGIYCTFAFFGVLLGLSEPKDWPPFYGSISDAYTLRGLWSRSWHQSNTHKLNSISRYVTYDLLKIQPRTPAAKYTRICAAFAASALMHLLIDIAAGVSVYDSGAIMFFCAQALGILVEDLFRAACRCVRGQDKVGAPSTTARVVGYVWVGAFLVWLLPAYLYPMMRRSALGLEDSVVPMSLIKLVWGLVPTA